MNIGSGRAHPFLESTPKTMLPEGNPRLEPIFSNGFNAFLKTETPSHMKPLKSKLLFRAKDFAHTQQYFDIYWDDQKMVGWTEFENSEGSENHLPERYAPHRLKSDSLQDQFYRLARRLMCRVKFRIFSSFLTGTHPRILDYGAGNGHFADYLKMRGSTVDLVEPNQRAFDECREKGHRIHRTLSDLSSDSMYQVITLWHVLEHLTDPWETVKELGMHLEDHGALVIAVPNFESFDAKKYKAHWAALDVPRHLWHFTPSGLTKLFEDSGFEIVNRRTLVFDSFYISLLSEKFKRSKLWMIKGIFFGAISNIWGTRTRNFSSMVFVVKKGSPNP